MPRSHEPPRDPTLAAAAGDAYVKLARIFVRRLRSDAIRGLPSFDDGELIASATNLSLGIEVYLKALLVLLHVPVPKTHDLARLYGDLPDSAKRVIQSRFEAIDAPPSGAPVGACLALWAKPAGSPPISPPSEVPEADATQTVPAILTRACGAFVTWRYLYERADTDAYRFFEYEFESLDRVARALAAELRSRFV